MPVLVHKRSGVRVSVDEALALLVSADYEPVKPVQGAVERPVKKVASKRK